MIADSLGFRRNVEAVEAAIPLPDYAGALTELRSLGGRAWYTGRCPLPEHDDSDPSFYIYPDEDRCRWHCYGCGERGDLLDLHQLVTGCEERWVALVDLAQSYGVELGPAGSWSEKQARQQPVRDGIERVKVRSAHRRLYRIMEPFVLAVEDPDERRIESDRVWRDLEPVARGVVAGFSVGDSGE